MNLMLSVIFVSVAIGVLARTFGRRQQVAIVTLACTMTALYYFLPNRFL